MFTVRGSEILKRLPEGRDCSAVEVGVWRGDLSRFLLSERSDLVLYMVDRWVPAVNGSRYHQADTIARSDVEDFRRAHHRARERTQEFFSRRHMVATESKRAASYFADEHFDLVFLDADHTLEGVRGDLAAWSRKVRRGGYIGGHDWRDDHDDWAVEEAVREFFPGREPELGENFTWFLKL